MTAWLEGKELWSLPPPAPVSRVSGIRNIHVQLFLLLKHSFVPGDVTKIPRTSSVGTVSSNDDADEKDGTETSFEPQSKTF